MLTFIRETIYDLKRQYGTPLEIYAITSSTVDLETGVKAVTKSVYRIRQAILLPRTVARQVVNRLGEKLLFKQGGSVDQDNRLVIVDMRDYPASYQVRVNDYAVIDHQRYEIKSAEQYDHRLAVLITLVATQGENVAAIINRSSHDDLHIQGSVTDG